VAAAAFGLADRPGEVKVDRTGSGFAATAVIRDGGRLVRIGGPVDCAEGHRVSIHVTLTQRRTGAYGRGTWRGRCTLAPREWRLSSVRAQGRARFVPGRAHACGAGVAFRGTAAQDAAQWCDDVRLVRP
jgi:hypothetical protein